MTIWQFTIPDNLLAGISHVRAKANTEGNSFDTDFAYAQQRLFDMLNSWEATRQADLAAPPVVTPVPVTGVPQEVTRRQAIQALINFGLLPMVQGAIDGITDPMQRLTMQNEWDNSQTFQRNRPSLVALATVGLGLTNAQLDNLFVEAAKL